MKKETLLVGTIGLLLGIIFGYAISGSDSKEYGPGMMFTDDGPMMMDHSSMMVSSEREFIEGMIPHHQEAVDTAREVQERGGTTLEIQELVADIIVAQEAEIALMKQWYQDWYGEVYVDDGEYKHMMRELEGLAGVDIDRVFLEDMIMHHMGAIMMARSVRPHIEHDEIINLADAIEKTQSDEISQMRAMLRDLQ